MLIKNTFLTLIPFVIYAVIKTNTLAPSKSASSTLSHDPKTNAQYSVPLYETIHGYYLKDLAVSIGTFLQDISNRELGVPVMQEMYDSLEFVPIGENIEKKLKNIADKITQKLTETLLLLNATKDVIEQRYEEILTSDKTDQLWSAMYPCTHVPSAYLWDTYNKFFVKNESEINQAANYIQYLPFTNSKSSVKFNLTEVFAEFVQSTSSVNSGIKQIYFLSSHDTVSTTSSNNSFCTLYDNTAIWMEYISRITNGSKHLLILLDHGSGLSGHQLYLAKTIAKSLISMLSSRDTISLIALSDTFSAPYIVNQCSSVYSNDSTFVPATEFNKEKLYNFIDLLVKSKNITNHTLGFEQSFNTIRSYVINNGDVNEILLVYISRGLLSSLTEAKTVLQTLASQQLNLLVPVYISTCLVIDDLKPLIYEKHFLTDIAKLNFTKYNISTVVDGMLTAGIIQSISSVHNLGLVSARYFSILSSDEQRLDKAIRITTPKCDSLSKEATITLSTTCGKLNDFGVLAIDLYLNNLVEDILYITSHPKDSYAFLINMNGVTIMHKFLNQPQYCLDNNEEIDINLLERSFNFTHVRSLIFVQDIVTYRVETGQNNTTISYMCTRILEWYILCLVSNSKANMSKKLLRVSLPQNTDIVHHRLDLLPPQSVCRHLKQITSIASGVLYLSASCFVSPYSQLRSKWETDISPRVIEHYMAYLKDHTGLIANPGFKPEIRNEVLSLLHIMTYLKIRHLSGSLRQYAVRRYVASAGGVLQVYPGTNMQPGLDPLKRIWYQRALKHPGRVILSPPYLDAGGAGYIVTLSHTVYEGKKKSMHTTKDTVFAVMGIDLTLGYFYKLLVQKMPFCKQSNVKCFLMDDNGYLISHPSLVDPNGRGPVEQIHIVNKESVVANDILNQKYFVKKILCNNFVDGTMQRYYQFNTSFTGIVRNMIHGEHCSKYQISAIPGTNLFVGVVNSSCENSATFCPCSMIDRLCLNCNRMEQTECECPCECPLNLHACPNHQNTSFLNNPICPTIINDHFTTPNILYSKISNIKQCSNFHCELYTTQDSCMGIVGCEWCQIDVDGETPLETPFCTALTSCFNGILGSVTPYGDSPIGPITSGDLLASTYSAIGPVAGSLVILCLVLSLIIYFYRQHYISIGTDELYLETGPDQGQLSTLRVNHLEMDDINEERDGYRDRLMVYNLEPVSPYRLSTVYRRPHTTGDSDHGYSTMTPHDESEHLSVALVEPLLTLNDETLSDIGSNSTSISSAENSATTSNPTSEKPTDSEPVPEMTSLPYKHCLLVPVTVHRDMETT